MNKVNAIADELLVSLRDLERIDIGHGSNNYREYNLPDGVVRGWGMHRDDLVHAFRAELDKGCVFPPHDHATNDETFIVYVGKIQIVCEDEEGNPKDHILEKGDSIKIPKGKNHKFIALEDSKVMSVIIPPDGAI